MSRAGLGLVVGGLLALAIACGGGAKPVQDVAPPPRADAKAELARLDQEITAQMQALGEARPTPAACEGACPQPMARAEDMRAPSPPTCKPSNSDTCTQACTLKTSICENAAKICTIASDLGGKDAYANETCDRGAASCEAAKQRCCGCM